LQRIVETQVRMEEQIKTLFKRQAEIKDLTETVQRLAITLEKQQMAIQSTERKVDSVKSDVDEIKAKPTKRWETIVAALITGVIGFLFAKFGLK